MPKKERRDKLEPAIEESRPKRKILKIYTVIEKPNSPRGIWLEIGVASENRDGSLSGKLDCLPVNGSIQIRPWEPRKNDSYRRNSDNHQAPPSQWSKGGEPR